MRRVWALVRFLVWAAVVCAGYGSGVFEAAQEVRLGVDAGLEEFAQEDGSAESHGVECDGKRRFVCDQKVDDMGDEGAHGRVIDTVGRERLRGFHGWSVTALACR